MTGRATHGHSRGGTTTREFNSWLAMRQRCTDPKHEKWPSYGGRGITVCRRWMESFESFLADMGPCPPGNTIGRKDNDGNYEPSNCRWESVHEQANNRRNNRIIEFDGLSLTISQWAQRIGLSKSALHSRIAREWPIHLALDPNAQRRQKPEKPAPAWKSLSLCCANCGAIFSPVSSRSRCCSHSCRKALTKRESHNRNRDEINERRRQRRRGGSQ